MLLFFKDNLQALLTHGHLWFSKASEFFGGQWVYKNRFSYIIMIGFSTLHMPKQPISDLILQQYNISGCGR